MTPSGAVRDAPASLQPQALIWRSNMLQQSAIDCALVFVDVGLIISQIMPVCIMHLLVVKCVSIVDHHHYHNDNEIVIIIIVNTIIIVISLLLLLV